MGDKGQSFSLYDVRNLLRFVGRARRFLLSDSCLLDLGTFFFFFVTNSLSHISDNARCREWSLWVTSGPAFTSQLNASSKPVGLDALLSAFNISRFTHDYRKPH